MFAQPSLCYSAFPVCNANRDKPPHRICREDCELLENELCRLEYALAKSHELIGKQLSLPECEDFPPTNSEDSIGCLELGIQKAPIQTQGMAYFLNWVQFLIFYFCF